MILARELAGVPLCAGCLGVIDTNTASQTVTLDGVPFLVHRLGPCRRWLREQ